MARPVIPAVRIFASDTLFTTGPVLLQTTVTKIARSNAQIDEGFVGLETPPAQEYNSLWNQYTTWTKWVGEGSNLPDLDDHIIETDSAGLAQISEAAIGGTAATSFLAALVATANASGDGILATATTTRAIQAQNTSATNPAILAGNSGTGDAIEGQALLGGTGVVGRAIVTAGVGLKGFGFLTGSGLEAIGGATGKGIIGIGGATSGIGVEGQSATTSAAMAGVSTSTVGTGVQGTIPAAATVSAVAVRATTGTGDGTALNARSDAGGGYAVQAHADTSSPKRAALRLVPQDADPTTHATGDAYYNSVTTTLKARTASGFQHVLASNEGYCYGFGLDAAGAHNSVSFVEFASAGLASPHDPKVVGDVVLTVTGQFRNEAAALNTVRVRIIDKTATVTIATYDIRLDQTNALVTTDLSTAYEKTISFIHAYTIPSAGARTFSIEIATDTGGGTGAEWVNLHLEVRGVY